MQIGFLLIAIVLSVLAGRLVQLQGIDPEEIITVRTRRAPMMSTSARLRL